MSEEHADGSSTPTAETPPPPAPPAPPTLPEWAEIAAEGGMRPWVDAELRRRGLIEDVDPSTLSDKQRKQFKARREQERKVRRELSRHAWAAFRRSNMVHLGEGIFYHDTVDVDRYDVDDPPGRLSDNELSPLADARALAAALEMPLPRLRWLCYHREVDTGTHYNRWLIPKRSGGQRLISSPKPDLKAAQRWVAQNISERLPVHGAAHGFLVGRSTASNAAPHAGAKIVVKLDLKDFYPTITMPRVRGLFRKAGYNEQVATLLALLCTEAPREELDIRGQRCYVALGPRSLPQGAPTSPSITNSLSLRMDARLAGFARATGWVYTRYADDLTFSWHDGERPGRVGPLLGMVEEIVREEGFALHRKKTRVMRSGSRQQVTGLVVNALMQPTKKPRKATAEPPKARVPRQVQRQLRAAIKNRELGRPGREGESLEQLRGLAAYIHMTDPAKGRALLERIDALGQVATAPETSEEQP
jgi:RNA-directed DNA polymerase